MKIDKRDVARLLEGFSDPHSVSLWEVAKSYKILRGVIYADDPQPVFRGEIDADDLQPDELRVRGVVSFGDPDLFFSFARLGARGEPSESSILRWVSEHGLLRREKGPRSDTDVNQAPISVADFRAEVLRACQLLTLYMNIREEDFEALESKIGGIDEKRHLSSYWPHTPRTDLEIFFANCRDVPPEWGNVEAWDDVYIALVALTGEVKDRLADVRLDFDIFSNYPGAQSSGSDYRIPRSWDCPDLLSAMYLQFYLLITDSEPVRRCQNPACGLPFPATRKNKRFCNATCRSNARNYR